MHFYGLGVISLSHKIDSSNAYLSLMRQFHLLRKHSEFFNFFFITTSHYVVWRFGWLNYVHIYKQTVTNQINCEWNYFIEMQCRSHLWSLNFISIKYVSLSIFLSFPFHSFPLSYLIHSFFPFQCYYTFADTVINFIWSNWAIISMFTLFSIAWANNWW